MTSLASDKTPHTFIRITTFYTRFATLQFLTTLLHKRRFQSYLLTAPAGPGSVMMGMVIFSIGAQIKAASLFKVQKVPAFEGAFEILFNTVSQERGVDGVLIAQGALQHARMAWCASGVPITGVVS